MQIKGEARHYCLFVHNILNNSNRAVFGYRQKSQASWTSSG